MEFWNNTQGGVTVTLKIPIFFHRLRQDKSPDSQDGAFTGISYRVDK